MKAYLYDENTKEFLEEVEAQLDQLESKISQKEIYLLPANATFKKPLKNKNGFINVFQNDGWVLIEDHRKEKIINKDGISEINYIGTVKDGDIIISDEQEKLILKGDLIYENNVLHEKVLTIEEQNNNIKLKREQQYKKLTDSLTMRKIRKQALNEWNDEQEKEYIEELNKLSKQIEDENPYIVIK